MFPVKRLAMEHHYDGHEIDLAFIAELAHETTAQYARQIGEDAHLSWGDSPEWVRNSAMAGVSFHILNPNATAKETHDQWLLKKQEEGWSCGPTKDSERKTHPCMVPYEELSTAHRIKDHLFKAVVDAIVAGLQDHGRSLAVEHCGCEDVMIAYDGAMGSVSMEGFGDTLKSFWNWLQSDGNEKKPDLKELKVPNAGDYFSNKEYSTGQISDKKIIERLNWGESPLNPTDHHYFTEKIAEPWANFVDELVGGDRNVGWAIEQCGDLVKQINAGKKISKHDVRKTLCRHLPNIFLPLPGGKAFVSDGSRFTIELVGRLRPVEKGVEEDFVALDKSFSEAAATITDASMQFKHWYLLNDVWEDSFDIDFDTHAEILDVEWIWDECLAVMDTIFKEYKTLIKHWADASRKK